jgi:hypothetical protein
MWMKDEEKKKKEIKKNLLLGMNYLSIFIFPHNYYIHNIPFVFYILKNYNNKFFIF